MSSLLSLHSVSKSHGAQSLFEEVSFTVNRGDRIGLIGPNGSGKSSLLKIMLEIEPPDSGQIIKKHGLQLAYASQEPEFPSITVEEILLQEVPDKVQAQVLLGKAQFSDPTQNASKLSGGWKKRLDIIRALMKEPDLLVLDEPTNHLDLEGILWLESFLRNLGTSFVVVSHDRYFLESVANKIVELNRCYPKGIFSSEGGMIKFYERREQFLTGQEGQEKGLASAVRREKEWLKQSPKARATKSNSRIKKANEMIDELARLKERNRFQTANIDFTSSSRQTRKLLVAKNIGKTLGEKELFKELDLTLSPGVRLGLVGMNGSGKTTLMKVLAGQITPDKGTLKYADDLKIVYFDQHREQVPLNLTLREALCPSGDTVYYRGLPIHVSGWAKRFLFSSDKLQLPLKHLSGGERARILIAKLMLEPADVLFLDEPTNDLDIQTLEIIEESLQDFNGAVVLISHDRCLMDKVCTQVVGLGGDLKECFFADYSQWEKASKQSKEKRSNSRKPKEKTVRSSKKIKLTYNEQRELAGMEEAITEVEEVISALEKRVSESSSKEQPKIYQEIAKAQEKHDKLFERWQELLDIEGAY